MAPRIVCDTCGMESWAWIRYRHIEDFDKDSFEKLWFVEDEDLPYKNLDDAVEDRVEVMSPKEIKNTIIKAHRGIPKKRCRGSLDRSVLEYALKQLDENYGNHDMGSTATPAMLTAFHRFEDALLREYEVVQAKKTADYINISAEEWVLKNHPEWLNDEE